MFLLTKTKMSAIFYLSFSCFGRDEKGALCFVKRIVPSYRG